MKEFGVLLAVSSLPTPYGVGDLGGAAHRWLDLLHGRHVNVWQILPLNPLGYGNSPYQPYSSFAGDPLYLSLDVLHERGLIDQPTPYPGGNRSRVQYEEVRAWKEGWLKQAYQNFSPDEGYDQFIAQTWVQEYAQFRALKLKHGERCWVEWPQEDKHFQTGSLSPELQEAVNYQLFLQYEFARQWSALHAYAQSLNISIMGDIPFYVGLDSADVWAHPERFLLDSKGYPTSVAGVPPDYFSEIGQRWGNPIYDWDYLKKENYAFWVERIGYNQTQFDIIRIDHFRAFDTYWKIPASCPTAVEGAWLEPPGYEVIDTLRAKIPGLNLVAEDLGDLRPEVMVLRDHYHLKGMTVFQFLFDFTGRQAKYLAEGREYTILYSGTHDNATLKEWYDSLPCAHRRKLRRWLKTKGLHNGSVVRRMIQYLCNSPAETVILPLSDLLELPAHARMNTPGTMGSPNWEWRLTNEKDMELALQTLGEL